MTHQRPMQACGLLLSLLVAPAWAQTAAEASARAPTEQRRAEERQLQQREALQRGAEVWGTPDVPLPALHWPEHEAPCVPVRHIALTGAESDRFQFVLQDLVAGADPAIGRCLGTEGVSIAVARAQRRLTARGFSRYSYFQSVAGLYQDYRYSGSGAQQDITLSRLVHRDGASKTTLQLKAFARQSRNFIDDTEIEVQRRATGGWVAGNPWLATGPAHAGRGGGQPGQRGGRQPHPPRHGLHLGRGRPQPGRCGTAGRAERGQLQGQRLERESEDMVARVRRREMLPASVQRFHGLANFMSLGNLNRIEKLPRTKITHFPAGQAIAFAATTYTNDASCGPLFLRFTPEEGKRYVLSTDLQDHICRLSIQALDEASQARPVKHSRWRCVKPFLGFGKPTLIGPNEIN